MEIEFDMWRIETGELISTRWLFLLLSVSSDRNISFLLLFFASQGFIFSYFDNHFQEYMPQKTHVDKWHILLSRTDVKSLTSS